MSWNPLQTVDPDMVDPDAIETLIVPRSRDIEGFAVRRALPAAGRRMVGPFIFFDHLGPVEFLTGQGMDVRPHPHIGLATVTYLLEGSFRHRDSLGSNQMIHPGDVNWMIAGRGVTHSERTSEETRRNPASLSGIQTWVALPEAEEDAPPLFEHQPKAALPLLEGDGVGARLILGSAWGERAPVSTFHEMFYADAVLTPGAAIPLPDDHEDRGVYVLDGAVEIAGDRFEAGRMAVFRPGDRLALRAGEAGARVMLLGGETLSGPRYIWWNFVASSRERIEEAKRDWIFARHEGARFALPPGDDGEFVPLP
ncbi:MAG: pirin family protein [Pikeienuella sp.]